MAGLLLLFTSLLCSVNYGRASTEAVLHVSCPTTFSESAANDITARIDHAKLIAAGCAFSNKIDFTYTPLGSQTLQSLRTCLYPPTNSCSNNIADDSCGCTFQDSNYYVYTYKFLADKSREGGKISASACVAPRGTYDVSANTSCRYIRFAFTGAVVHVNCPTSFSEAVANDITARIDHAQLMAAECTFANNIDFTYTPLGSQTPQSLRTCSYPPTNGCSNNIADDNCGCTSQDSNYYVYTYKFLADKSREGGKISASACVQPSGTYDFSANASCNYIRFVSESVTAHVTKHVTTLSVSVEKSASARDNTSAVGIGIAIAVGVVAIVMTIAVIIAYNKAQAGPPAAQAASRRLSARLTSTQGPSTGAPLTSDGAQNQTANHVKQSTTDQESDTATSESEVK